LLGDISQTRKVDYILRNVYFEDFTDESRAGGFEGLIEPPKATLYMSNITFRNISTDSAVSYIHLIGPSLMFIEEIYFLDLPIRSYAVSYSLLIENSVFVNLK